VAAFGLTTLFCPKQVKYSVGGTGQISYLRGASYAVTRQASRPSCPPGSRNERVTTMGKNSMAAVVKVGSAKKTVAQIRSERPIRFAALIRVSTEKQAAKGESLRTQGTQTDRSVEQIGGTIVARYAGQEHATEGFDRQLLNNLLIDAQKKPRPFDAVIVADPSRWSRDNIASETGLEILRKAGVRFFVLTTEYDLFDPNARLFLGLSSTIGAFHARTQKQKSILNRIERAKRGSPTCGKVPFGRVWDSDKKTWTIDPTKQSMIVDVAERFLKGESLPRMAKEYKVNHANLVKILRERCGDVWTIDFDSHDLNIHEQVILTIPRLLPESTIKAIRQRLTANRTYLHKTPRPKYEWLLQGHIFCAQCGYGMFGQINTTPKGEHKRYYRHAHGDNALKCEIRPRPYVDADRIEEQVIGQLFDMFGNPTAIERAVNRAIPDCDKTRKRLSTVEDELAKVEKGRNRVVGMIAQDLLTDEQAASKLRELKERESILQTEREQLNATLADVPDEPTLRKYVQKVKETILVYDGDGTIEPANDVQTFVDMTRTERRNLVEAVFRVPLADGKPAGIYVTPDGQYGPTRRRKFTFTVRGRLDFECVMKCASH